MESKAMEFVTIDVFIHLKGTSYGIVSNFKKFIDSKIIDVDDIKLITIDYDTSSGDVTNGPVRIYFASGYAIYLNLTAGYSGSGPTDLCEVLRLCKIDFNEDDIKSEQDVVKLRYCKEPNKCYQFAKHDETYEYSV